jgi:hypothetical protein
VLRNSHQTALEVSDADCKKLVQAPEISIDSTRVNTWRKMSWQDSRSIGTAPSGRTRSCEEAAQAMTADDAIDGGTCEAPTDGKLKRAPHRIRIYPAAAASLPPEFVQDRFFAVPRKISMPPPASGASPQAIDSFLQIPCLNATNGTGGPSDR